MKSCVFARDFSWIIDEILSPKVKETIRAKCKGYLKRAEKLKEYLNTGKGMKKPIKDKTSSK